MNGLAPTPPILIPDGIGNGLGEGDTPSGKTYRLGLNILVHGLSH